MYIFTQTRPSCRRRIRGVTADLRSAPWWTNGERRQTKNRSTNRVFTRSEFVTLNVKVTEASRGVRVCRLGDSGLSCSSTSTRFGSLNADRDSVRNDRHQAETFRSVLKREQEVVLYIGAGAAAVIRNNRCLSGSPLIRAQSSRGTLQLPLKSLREVIGSFETDDGRMRQEAGRRTPG